MRTVKSPRVIGSAALSIVALLLVAQILPYGRRSPNPRVIREPAWDSAATRQLAQHACFDCHSNETVWPWYTGVAPVSWLLASHVREGRKTLNFSEWDRRQPEAKDSAETVRTGTMPPWPYVLLHPKARLSDTEREALIRGFEATFGGTDTIKNGKGNDTVD